HSGASLGQQEVVSRLGIEGCPNCPASGCPASTAFTRGGGETSRRNRLRSVRKWVAVGLTIACLVALSSRARIPSLEEAARQARYDLLAVALLLSLLSIICKAARWRALYPAGGRPELGFAVAAVAV